MKGAHRIIVQNKRIRYDFIIKRNLTVIRGDSATGKTTLVDMIREYFEWMILSSGILEDGDLPEILEHPENQIDSSEFFSWERYFNACLVQLTRDSYLKYNKRQLNPVYLGDKVPQKIVDVMEGVDLSRETC